jgi:selenocysteine lyase/cysteine desulfurase
MADRPLFPPSFYSAPGVTHVCAAGESLPLRAHNTALANYLNEKAAGHTGRTTQTQYLDDVRALISQTWNANDKKEIGFAPSVADGVSLIVESLEWKQGDNICLHENEFPSLVGPFALKNQQNRPGEQSPEIRYHNGNNLKSVVDHKTRFIAVSYVSFFDSSRVDLSIYRQLADSVGAILLVDFTQAAGYAPIDASIADFAFSACYKWLLGTSGVAIAYWNQKRQPDWRPATGGWHSLALGTVRPDWTTTRLEIRNDAMCFSRGNPAHLPIYLLGAALDYLSQWSVTDIEKHVQSLTSTLLEKLQIEGISSSTPIDKARHGASVTIDCAGASEIVNEMAKSGVFAWNGQGRVRFSFHGYNCLGDVDRIMEVFPPLWRKFNTARKSKI